jgi:hypothetical protein
MDSTSPSQAPRTEGDDRGSSPTAELHEGTHVRGSVRWPKALLAPWAGIVKPRRAAACLAGSSGPALIGALLTSALAVAIVILVLALWEATSYVVSVDPAGAISLGPQAGYEWRLEHRTIAETWRAWHANGFIGPAEYVLFFVTAGVALLAAFLAWLQLPYVHQGEAAASAYRRSVGAVTSCMGLLFVLTGFCGVLGFGLEAMNLRDQYLGCIMALAIPGSIWWCVIRITQAGSSARGPVFLEEGGPLCEGCGYNLTHQPADGRCPECAARVIASLTPGPLRRRTAWEKKRSAPAWITTTLNVLTKPGAFYRSLRLTENEDHPRSYARWHYPLIGFATMVWLFCCVWSLGPSSGDPVFIIAMVAMLITPLCGWGVHRLAGALAFSVCLAHKSLPDLTRMRRVMAYETAYLWVLCLYNGLLFTSLFIWGMWMSELVGRGARGVGYIPLEPLAVLLGNLLFTLLWFWRYRIAIRAVRWSNF